MPTNKPYSSNKTKKSSEVFEPQATVERMALSSRHEALRQSSASASFQLTDEQIAKRAFEIWNERGRPGDSDLDNWLQAERELRGPR